MNIESGGVHNMLSIKAKPIETIGLDDNSIQYSGIIVDNSKTELIKECNALFEHLELNGQKVLKSMEDSMDEMQESFLADLRTHLDNIGINLDERIMISLTEEGGLLMEGQFTGAENMEELAEISKMFGGQFKMLAARAAIVQGLEQICKILQHNESAEEYDYLPKYKACLKGGLSHFYLA